MPALTAFSTGVHSGPAKCAVLMPMISPLCFLRHLGGRPGLHVGEVLFELAAAHAVADDVEERQHARLGAVDDAVLERVEIAPARAARIGDRGHAHAKREAVGIDAVVAGVGVALAGAGEHVHVNIDQPRRHVQPADVDRLEGLGGVDRLGDLGDLAVEHGHVAHRADVVLGVDQMSAAQQQVVLRLLRAAGGGERGEGAGSGDPLAAREAERVIGTGRRRHKLSSPAR